MTARALKLLVAAAAILFTSVARADDIPPTSWNESLWDTIESVYPIDEGYAIILRRHTYAGHAPGCSGGRQFFVRTSDPNYEEKARTLLAAFLAGREIMIYWDTSDACRAHINRFQIR